MSKKTNPDVETESSSEVQTELKTCFIIMPISDHEKYSPGHFGRVYEYIIKPACEASGFVPIRADDVKTTNYIALDIVKQIIESDMAICDLSSQNPNVLYEVGIRQAFNLPVTFIKDSITKRIFDIQGFRDVPYDENLRIDTVEKTVEDLTEIILNTFNNKEGINSLVTLLGIEPAKVSTTPISLDTELILKSIKGIESRISGIEKQTVRQVSTDGQFQMTYPLPENAIPLSLSEVYDLKEGQLIFFRRYGIGKVLMGVSTHEIGDRIIIEFPRYGVKNLNPKMYKLYKVE